MQTQQEIVETAVLDRDIWISAGRLIKAYGPQALSKAAQEVAYYSNHGDMASETAWKRVTSAIVMLTSTDGQLPN